MPTPTTSGVYYDVNELSSLNSSLKEQSDQMKQIDKEAQFQNKKVLQYSLLLIGVVATIFFFNKIVNKK